LFDSVNRDVHLSRKLPVTGHWQLSTPSHFLLSQPTP